ncbi:Methyltransferase FkbM domain-containing protein [Methylobacterium phyllostachyos]|uniref:Methyltransferase FkbM domain-containing protein n=1 Tax=Methylobacterium phyllostachyos TaxID=582672 RepID=A0A1H0JE93_9HYPH|nr:FkbM family methyltransferase [Methylobacterium phyllostachyos]SDO42067.1 Methyltransferase FkbM domain-containing protein [Methylobacterium phyllostachyos]
MENELEIVFKSVLGIRDTLEDSISEIKSLIGPGQEAYAEPIDFLAFAARRASLSKAPRLQDLWVLFELGEKRNGYFVEFGAADGEGSTTLLLEKSYGWQGAIAEPARSRLDKLRASRSCYISNKFIYTDDGLKILFNDAGTIEDSSGGRATQGTRRGGKRYEVESVTLRSFLQAAEAPRTIDYMCINVEDDTVDLLERFDFSERDVTLFSIAAADAQQSEALGAVLNRNGYERRFKAFSTSEDWYIKRDAAQASRSAAA